MKVGRILISMNVFKYYLSGFLLLAPLALTAAAVKTGPEIGTTIPAFSLSDQNGKQQSLASISGPKGAMIVFYRSADW